MAEQKASFYDDVYRRWSDDAGWLRGVTDRALPAIEYAVGSVLDIGCGIGQCSNLVEGEYHGIDFSELAI